MGGATTMQRLMRVLGALALLAVGGVHLQQYAGADFKTVPTIGTLFLLNAIASGLVGLALLLPLERAVAARRADTAPRSSSRSLPRPRRSRSWPRWRLSAWRDRSALGPPQPARDRVVVTGSVRAPRRSMRRAACTG